MDQSSFLRLAKRELGYTYPALAARLGVSPRTIEKWSLNSQSRDCRKMPQMAVAFIAELLQSRKRDCLARGDRTSAETIDAILAQVRPQEFKESLATFDRLQRAAEAIAPMVVVSGRPAHFVTLAEKNAWDEKVEMVNARRIQRANAKTAVSR